jgi:hypothetical protein
MDERVRFSFALMWIVPTALGWSIATVGRVDGPVIHTTYFLTPQNQPIKVSAQAYLGTWANGDCRQETGWYDLNTVGPDWIQTGYFVDFDGFKLKALVGGRYACITVSYTTALQFKQETFQLVWDGLNYTHSLPRQSKVSIQ